MSNEKKSKKSKHPGGKPQPKPGPQKESGPEELSEDELETVAGGAVDIFAKLGDIKGESKLLGHKDEIQLESFSWGAVPTRK